MDPYFWTIIAEQRGAELRAEAAREHRLRAARSVRTPEAAGARPAAHRGWVRTHLLHA